MASPTFKFISKPYTSRILFFLVALTLIVFWQVRDFKFVNYDDNVYILDNPFIKNGLNIHSLKWALTADLTFESPYTDYWQPITMLSRILDIHLFGTNPTGHHEMNLLFHTVNVLLLFFVFRALTKEVWKSTLLACFFSLHPVQVEAVAWVTSRKDLLSTFFGILCIWFYSDSKRSEKKAQLKWWFSIFSFAASLMCKGMFVTMPLLLILVDIWPLRRFEEKWSWKKVIFDKWFFALIAGLFFMIPFIGQPGAFVYLSPVEIISKALHGYGKYLLKFLVPLWLGIYPQVMSGHFSFKVAGLMAVLLVGISVMVWKQMKVRPYLFFGWFWILITIAPVAGLNMMADRFLYVPLIGFLVIMIWGIDEVSSGFKISKNNRTFLSMAVIFIYAVLSYRQAPYWKDSKTAFTRALELNQDNFVCQNNLGLELLTEGKVDEALNHFQKSIEIYPGYSLAYNNIGIVFANFKKMTEEGLRYYFKAIELGPDVPQSYYNVANLYAEEGNRDLAIKFFKAGAAVNPHFQGKLTPKLVMMLIQDQQIRMDPNSADLAQTQFR